MKVANLTCPPGKIYIDPKSVVAISVCKGEFVKTQLWVATQEEPFNICEDIETVRKQLGWEVVK